MRLLRLDAEQGNSEEQTRRMVDTVSERQSVIDDVMRQQFAGYPALPDSRANGAVASLDTDGFEDQFFELSDYRLYFF